MNFIKNLISEIKTRLLKNKMPACIDEIDERDFGAKAIAGSPTKADLVDIDFQNIDPEWIDQLDTDFCVGAGKAYFKEATEKKKMSFAGAFAMGCKAKGYVPNWGISILAVMKGAASFGVPEEDKWKYKIWTPLSPNTSGRNYFANWRNMPQDVLDNAAEHKDASYFRIEYPYGWDIFDTFRAYLYKFKDKQAVIQTGVDEHNVTLIGQETQDGELKLKSIDSYGGQSINYRIGKAINGYRYFSRSEANQLFNGYMAFDIPRALAELLVEYNGKAIKTKDNAKCYLVKDGKKHYLAEEKIAWSNNCLLDEPYNVYEITKEDLSRIPDGEPAKFEDGKYYPIVRRIIEKYKIT